MKWLEGLSSFKKLKFDISGNNFYFIFFHSSPTPSYLLNVNMFDITDNYMPYVEISQIQKYLNGHLLLGWIMSKFLI